MLIDVFVVVALAAAPGSVPGAAGKQTSSSVRAGTVTFNDTIGPLLRRDCSPCHFEGGKVYARHPFDRYETIRALGKKLNTRLKGENADTLNRWIADGFPERR